ncbi:MAG: primosomal protein N' family DNA-binding protein, partial [Acidimicrobiales bacterium]
MAPDVAGIDKEFDYSVPADLDGLVAVGTSVRVPLHGRRVAGWVVADRVLPPPGVRLLAVRAVRGLGPAPEVVELARWAAWRWAGRLATV